MFKNRSVDNMNITLDKFLSLFSLEIKLSAKLIFFEKDKNDFENTIELGNPSFLFFI